MSQVLYWYCPECRYRLTDIEYQLARYAFDCPRCNRSDLDQFLVRLKDRS